MIDDIWLSEFKVSQVSKKIIDNGVNKLILRIKNTFEENHMGKN